jgi:hypothetical protein
MKSFYIMALIALCTMGCSKKNKHAWQISSPGKNAESVYLTRDNKGNPVIAWTERSTKQVNLTFATSFDDANSFSQNITVPLTEDVATHAEGMPKVAFKNDGTIILAYEKKAPTKENKYAGAIYFITSKDHGKSWSSEKYLHSDTIPGRSRSYFDIETLPDGEVGASWLDIQLNDETEGRSVLFAKTNSTNVFTDEILIDSSACQCCRIDVYKDVNDNVYVAYRGLRKGNMGELIRDMMVTTSVDRGMTFTSPFTISTDNWNIDGCPHTGPSLCSNKAGLFTLWYTEGNGNGVYYTHKSGNDEFLPRELVSNAGRHPQVSANEDLIAMLWEENSDEAEKKITNVHYRLIKDGADTEKQILTPKDVNAYLPVVTQTRTGFLVAYLMEVDDHVSVYWTKL